ncbi:tRNA (adenine22-N1)-methyltransferase [Virgibacillus subterraneus]|uniref:tRNA (Adenine22-N1)-methyltransferase n=1 Tax=Virgibacillus subterraneus TaxID=621109 RepID=A0A1H9DXQ4_9BACI|nr:tRNA (adenine(22)-N(1))-methyltransferase TrmK [Virgibacillus subterraneus]SEQ18290.1 tRNA (adenine22-N1)-methyltransferase [Virgibacillus subterraneus]
MNNIIKLSERLSTVATFITEGAVFADIGSDHAYLPCYVCLYDSKAHAIAGEVKEGPFKSAIETVNKYDLSSRVQVRLGDGLHVIQDREVNLLVVAGMGGTLIRSILEEGKDRLCGVQRIIAQPNVNERNVRKWLYENNYTITCEEILEENGHIYEIIVADRNAARSPYKMDLLQKQLLFGPLLLEHKTETFIKKWKNELSKRIRVIDEMKKAREQNQNKISEFEKELSWVQEVLKNGGDNSKQ